VHWKGALNKCIEQIHWLINIHKYTLSLIYQKKKRKWICHYYQRERKRKDILLRLEEFRLWKTQGFRLRLVIFCRTNDSVILVRTASAWRLTEQLIRTYKFYPLNITVSFINRENIARKQQNTKFELFSSRSYILGPITG
jgi:hypothetical protein